MSTVRDPTADPRAARERRGSEVRGMFDAIAPHYDRLNHLLSLNIDKRWRRRAAASLGELPEGPILDLCGGTGDLTVELARRYPDRRLVCADFATRMLRLADAKFERAGLADRCETVTADARELPFEDDRFAAVTIAFGLRNLDDRERGLAEMRRVLRPGGRLAVLEFSRPTAPVIAPAYRLYLRHVLPRIGDRVSGRFGPYGYLARTISDFPGPEALERTIREIGFARCEWFGMTGGIVALHVADR